MSRAASAAAAAHRRPVWTWPLALLVACAVSAMLPLSILTGDPAGLAVFALLIGAPTCAVGVVVVWHRPANPLGWLLAGITGCLALSTDGDLYAILDYTHNNGRLPLGPVAIWVDGLWILGFVLFGLVIALFPDGRLLSRRWRAAVGGYLAIVAVLLVTTAAATAMATTGHRIVVDSTGALAATSRSDGWMRTVQGPLVIAMAVLWVSFVAHQVLTWRRASAELRQQLKWLAAGGTACLVGIVLLGFNQPGGYLAFVLLPVSIGVGILKYRLYEIDRIVSRTLAYALVTGLLVGAYVALVALASLVTGSSSSLVVAVSTLVVAALFNPVRRRVQRVVDRRFNRARYDAADTVAAFSTHLQDEVDLAQVQAELVRVVRQVLAPGQVSLWTPPQVPEAGLRPG